MNALIKTMLAIVLLSLPVAMPSAWGQSNDPLELQLEFDQATFLPGEPVVAYVKLVNRGEDAVDVFPRLAADLETVYYLIKSPDGKERVFETFALFELPDRTHHLAAGEAIYGFERLHFGPRGWTFPTPGRYEVRAIHRSGAQSSTQILNIVPSPPGNASADSEAVLASRQVGKFFTFGEGDHLREAVEILDRMNPERSVIGAYASYMLGSSWSKGFANYAAKEFRPARPQQAIRKLSLNGKTLPSFYFEAKRLLLLKLNLERLGDRSRAARASARLQSLRDASQFSDWLPAIEQHINVMYEEDPS